MSNSILEYVNLKIYYSNLVSLYQRLTNKGELSPIEAGSLRVCLDLLNEKIKAKEEELKVVQ
jgi:hypothetical protein